MTGSLVLVPCFWFLGSGYLVSCFLVSWFWGILIFSSVSPFLQLSLEGKYQLVNKLHHKS
jgi:hypothetical protein